MNINIIKCGAFHSLALTQFGDVNVWGWNYGKIGCGDNKKILMPTKVKNLNKHKIKMISCGCYHSRALTESSCVYIWGNDRCGQLGIENIKSTNEPKRLELKDIFIDKITYGVSHSLLLTNDGVIYAFVNNSIGQIGNRIRGSDKLTPV